jgi:Trehalase
MDSDSIPGKLDEIGMPAEDIFVLTTFWSGGVARVQPPLVQEHERTHQQTILPFDTTIQMYTGRFSLPRAGTAVFDLVCTRSIRLWLGEILVLDEELDWRSFQREIRAAVLFPCTQGELAFRVEVGRPPTHPSGVDQHSPSRNRAWVLSELQRLRPDALCVIGKVEPTSTLKGIAPLSLRFLPAQFQRDGILWQHLLVRSPFPEISASAPEPLWPSETEVSPAPFALRSNVSPGHCQEGTNEADRRRGARRWYVPVVSSRDDLKPLRAPGPETRVEPFSEIVHTMPLIVEYPSSSLEVSMPVYEALGRLAPQQEYQAIPWPSLNEARTQLPEPVLPSHLSHLTHLYDAAWEMLLSLVRYPSFASGLPGSYVSIGSNFPDHLFVWDTAFTALCTAYGHRALPATASLDALYSRQFDGGYIHRENDVHDGLPALYEPDFSPNPPMMTIAEWKLASVTGDTHRLAQVYPVLRGYHRWLEANRRLPDGTYWTTGLANGMDNSPSLGEGYPCLTAQMAHDAETLGKIARILGEEEEAWSWEQHYAQIGNALNAVLWDEDARIYAASLPKGEHNPNKIVTAFWPLWAGVVPPTRVDALIHHLQDPRSFWRHHPLPSLAADSPFFKPEGEYWLGSTWPPTNYVAIKGLERVGMHGLAYSLTMRHLQCVFEVWNQTGKLWENYCSERSVPGNNSAPDYCWAALGPITLLLEVLIGLEPDALRQTLQWHPPEGEMIGVKHFSLGEVTISLLQQPTADGHRIEVTTDGFFHLELFHHGKKYYVECEPGVTEFLLASTK